MFLLGTCQTKCSSPCNVPDMFLPVSRYPRPQWKESIWNSMLPSSTKSTHWNFFMLSMAVTLSRVEKSSFMSVHIVLAVALSPRLSSLMVMTEETVKRMMPWAFISLIWRSSSLTRCSVSFLGVVGSAESRVRWQPSKPVKTRRTSQHCEDTSQHRRETSQRRRETSQHRRDTSQRRRDTSQLVGSKRRSVATRNARSKRPSKRRSFGGVVV